MRATLKGMGWVVVAAVATVVQPVSAQSVAVPVFGSAETIDQEDPGARTYQSAREALNR